jgi:hypothetical protein
MVLHNFSLFIAKVINKKHKILLIQRFLYFSGSKDLFNRKQKLSTRPVDGVQNLKFVA